jgi:hypothetical protein
VPVPVDDELDDVVDVVVEAVLDEELQPAASATTPRADIPIPAIPHLLRLRRSIDCSLLG